MSMALLTIESLDKTFHSQVRDTHVLDDIHLYIQKGEFVTIIGPSGCGKSTLLKIIAGLDTDYAGVVSLSGEAIEKPSKDKGFIFQEHRLFPWLTVEQNIAAELSLKDPEVRKHVDDFIQLVKLQGFEKSYPKQLSGGMSQRVAIARALLRKPKVLLLDEPFGALDAFTRSHMQEALLEIWQNHQTTMVFVTHDIDEALFLSNRVIVMEAKPGRIKANITIDLPYPRKRSGRSFQELRAKLVGLLEHETPDEEEWQI
ncbi:ABC transporter ATP-binding protein [Paenibacillus roseipurpureus]|uniref:ABC transporter ATP-binding protein n=1 Tax=Paenibacillus roseopurpureus TaxID=2918901 RepID=A0AA96RK97_9BACL|nr:ABC transporter ATP-binding protein [Paenibacillus sp. MBLB1832]WNR44076.1 ABC transporter ATP-binding protein [Paenibacillus sp. MBLB1832]